MPIYTAPTRDTRFVVNELLKLDSYGNLPGFDAGRAAPDDPGFAVFGRVVEGQEVVRKILAAPVSPTRGEGSMKGQMLEPVVKRSAICMKPKFWLIQMMSSSLKRLMCTMHKEAAAVNSMAKSLSETASKEFSHTPSNLSFLATLFLSIG